MLTLKIAQRGPEPGWDDLAQTPFGHQVSWRQTDAWISDVAQVTVLDRIPSWDIPAVMDKHYKHLLGDVEYHCFMGWPAPSTDDEPYRCVTLLAVSLPQATRWLLVEQAWLLCSNGDTIERVAP